MQKLLTKEILEDFRKTGSQENEEDPRIIAKFFNPTGAGTWYATEFNEAEGIFFGFVSIFGDWNDEWGNFTLAELESFRGRFGMRIERDAHIGNQKRFSEIKF